MQAVEGKTMKKKSKLRAFFMVVFLLLAAAAVAGYFFVAKPIMQQTTDLSFSEMPTDAAGNNLIGNLPENFASGGFLAGQNGYLYFANFYDNASLYMCKENGEELTKITNFPVANINVLADTLVFTGLEQCVSADTQGVRKVDFANPATLLSDPAAKNNVRYGGKLYAIYGVNTSERLDFTVIDPETTYFSPNLDKDGLYVSYENTPKEIKLDEKSEQSANETATKRTTIANKFTDSASTLGQDGEVLVKMFPHGSVIYIELQSANGNRIMRVDTKSLLPLDYIEGHDLYRVGNGFIFQNTADGFVYEISPDGETISPISATPLENISMNPFGEIFGKAAGSDVVITKTERYKGLTARIMPLLKQYTIQNGWYNYIDQSSAKFDESAKIFKANDTIYYLGKDGTWNFADGAKAEFLNSVPNQMPLAKAEDFVIEKTFTPPWVMFTKEGDFIEPSRTEDIVQEQPVTQDLKTDATADPHDALEATILLMLKDDRANTDYSAESIEKLKAYYGANLENAINAKSQSLSQLFQAQLGSGPSVDEMRQTIDSWLKLASYKVGGAEIVGTQATATLTTQDVADFSILYPALEAEVKRRAMENPSLLFMSKEKQTKWAVGVIIEVIKTPKEYNMLSDKLVDSHITMTNSGMWVVSDINALINSFIRGM